LVVFKDFPGLSRTYTRFQDFRGMENATLDLYQACEPYKDEKSMETVQAIANINVQRDM